MYLQHGNESNVLIVFDSIGLPSIDPLKRLTHKHLSPMHCRGSYDPSSKHLAVICGYLEVINSLNNDAMREHSEDFFENSYDSEIMCLRTCDSYHISLIFQRFQC